MLTPQKRRLEAVRRTTQSVRAELSRERQASHAWSRLAGEHAAVSELRRQALARAGIEDPAKQRTQVVITAPAFNRAMLNEVAYVLGSRPVPAKLAGELTHYVRSTLEEERKK